jgi:periplasmic protein TonB
MGWEGIVELRVLVDTQGRPADVTVVTGSGQAVLDQSAMEAVRRWKFSPALEAGKPVTRVHDIRIRFRLDDYPA